MGLSLLPEWSALSVFMVAALAVGISPGPGMLYAVGELHTEGMGRIYVQGIITNIVNPKSALFYLSFVPQFIDPSRGSPFMQFIVLGLIFNVGGNPTARAATMLGRRFKGADLSTAASVFAVMFSFGAVTGPPLSGVGMTYLGNDGMRWALVLIYALALPLPVIGLIRRWHA